LGEKEIAGVVRVVWPSGASQEFRDLAHGFRYEIEEGSSDHRAIAFGARVAFPAGAVSSDNTAGFADTWLLKPVPLPEISPGPGFLRLSNLSGDRAVLYGLFCRYLFDLRADVNLPVWFLVDEQSRAHKIYFSPPDPGDLQRMQIPVEAAGRYYTEPERNYTALGAALFAAGYPEHALRYLELAPKDSEQVLFAIGKIHLQAERWERARGYFEKGLALAPDSADGWNSLGAVELGVGRIQAALGDFDKALAIQPAMVSALINAAQAQVALGDRDAAEKLYRRALVERPNSEPAINSLASLYMSTGQSGNAIAALRYGIEVGPDEESFYLNLAILYVRLDNPEAARPVIDRLLVRKPGSVRGKQALRELEAR
jgi:Flp pilus assembly protein TadD